MNFCKTCRKVHPTVQDPNSLLICCTGCGRVVSEDIYSTEATFIKTAGGSQFAGNIIRSVQSDYSVSHERTLMKGREEISDIVISLEVGGGDSIINQSHALYTIAVERNFTKGRRTSHVAAACLYIACRQNSKPYLLIDFSEYLQINVYVLGAVFLQLCQLLRLEEHPIVQKPVDPSLFIHRFAGRLLGEKNFAVCSTAMRIIASMKRDWMQTGRKPSGLCGAALYISALSHGLKYSKSDIVNVVHVCEATLTRRLIEFENTESGSLTIEEFIAKAQEFEAESNLCPSIKSASKTSGVMEILCEHKDSGEPHFAHGLCRRCYDDFTELSGGLQGGADPPAFQRAENQRLMKVSMLKEAEQGLDSEFISNNEKEREFLIDKSDKLKDGGVTFKESDKQGTTQNEEDGSTFQESTSEKSQGHEHQDDAGDDESENFSDIDDAEVDGYLHTEEEKHYKKIIWEEMNKEYLEEQAVKEAAAAAVREAYEAAFKDCSDDVRAAQELAAAAAEAVAKSRKERRQKQAEEAKNAGPARTAAEATRKMLDKKRLSSKIDYDAIDKLFDDPIIEDTKKRRIDMNPIRESESYENFVIKDMDNKKSESDIAYDEFYQEDQFAEEQDVGGYSYYENQNDGYGYTEDYGSDY